MWGVGGCGNGPAAPATCNSLIESLVARDFVSNDVDGFNLVDGTEVHIRFAEDEISASSDCNMLGGRFSVDAEDATSGVIVLDANGLSTTDIGCDLARHAQDEWLLDVLASRPVVTLTDDGFVLADGTSTIDFVDREIVEPDRPLVGTDWTVDTIVDQDASSSVPGSSPVMFVFNDDGRVVVTSEGCTVVEVPSQRSGNTITFDEFTVDSIGCPTPWSESIALLRADTVTIAIDTGRLTLRTASGTGLSLFDPAS